MWTTMFAEYGAFILKSITVVILIVVLMGLTMKSKKTSDSGEVEIIDLTEKLLEQEATLKAEMLGEQSQKKLEKERRKKEKLRDEQSKRSRLFVLDYDGDIRAEAVASLREEITAILMLHQPGDEVLLRLESPGGTVNGYGLAASQLQRLRERQIPLTIAVDKVAASGGYMMACVANKIVAAPFSIIGSIGVVAQVPNIHRLLKKHDIDVNVMTAGEYKRTITFLGEDTEEGKQKFKEQLQTTHDLFKTFVSQNRPQLEMDKVATGETWYGTQALEMHLVDAVSTSDDLILEAIKDKSVYQVSYKEKKKLVERVGIQVESSIDNLVTKWLHRDYRMM